MLSESSFLFCSCSAPGIASVSLLVGEGDGVVGDAVVIREACSLVVYAALVCVSDGRWQWGVRMGREGASRRRRICHRCFVVKECSCRRLPVSLPQVSIAAETRDYGAEPMLRQACLPHPLRLLHVGRVHHWLSRFLRILQSVSVGQQHRRRQKPSGGRQPKVRHHALGGDLSGMLVPGAGEQVPARLLRRDLAELCRRHTHFLHWTLVHHHVLHHLLVREPCAAKPVVAAACLLCSVLQPVALQRAE
mmetsp:Transcript_47967/g.150489  ORF Transcript_47967/g.150489 Transcript_47967/m.150489 type:complete len:248 (+) Transcript_47967:480-1223(+)